MQINNIIKKIIVFLCILCIGFLLIQSLLMTTYYDANRRLYHISDNIVITCGMVLFLSVVFLFIHKRVELSEKQIKIVMTVFFCLNLLVAICSQKYPTGDQAAIVGYANRIVDGDYSGFGQSDYLGYYPFQRTIIFFYILIFSIFGRNNLFAAWLINIFCICITYYFVYKELLCQSRRKLSGEILFALMLFLPVTFYNIYVYGTVLGICCACIAMVFQQRFFRKNMWRDGLLAGVFIAMACALKTNYQIYLIGIIMGYLFYLLETKGNQWKKTCIIIGETILLKVLVNGIILFLFTLQTGAVGKTVDSQGGIPAETYIATGLQDSGGGEEQADTQILDINFMKKMNTVPKRQKRS